MDTTIITSSPQRVRLVKKEMTDRSDGALGNDQQSHTRQDHRVVCGLGLQQAFAKYEMLIGRRVEIQCLTAGTG